MGIYEKLDDVQKAAVEWLWPKMGAGLFAEQGVGKTWIALGLIERLIRSQGDVEVLLVGTLTNLKSTWLATIQEQLAGVYVAEDWVEFKTLPKPRIFLKHYEGVKPLIKRLKKHRWSLVVMDETQRLNSRGSRQSRDARLLRFQSRRLALSGTPIEQSPMDVWAQMRFIEPECFGDRWADFEAQYIERCGYMGYERRFREGLLPEFLERLKPYCLRIELKDVVDVKSQFHIERFDLLGEQARLYRELDEKMVTRYQGQRVMTPLRISTLIRLQQITGGFLTLEDGTVASIGQAKMRRLRSLIRSGKVKPPFVVFCRYTAEVEAVATEIKNHFNRVEVLWGKTGRGKDKSKVRAELNKRFQSGEIDVLVCQNKTGGVGIDLFRAGYAILYSLGFSYIDWSQILSRLLRRGQTKEVIFYYLCANGTIDEDINQAIEQKGNTAEVVLSRLKQGK